MVNPDSAVGAVKAMLTCPSPVVTETLLGALGTVAVAAEARVAAFTRNKATKQDLKCVTVEWRAKFIGLSLWLSHKLNIRNNKNN